MSIQYLDRESKKIEEEMVFGGYFLRFLYKDSLFSKILLHIVARSPFVSWAYGMLQKTPWSRKKVKFFVEKFNVNEKEFLKEVDEFTSFNDFFIRKLKKDARPITQVGCLPADGRYYAMNRVAPNTSFLVKGTPFDLERFLGSKSIAKRYEGGSLLLARLCPVDYHRFHFPVTCVPSKPMRISGPLFSVNPIATKKFPNIFWKNKREIISLQTEKYGEVQCVLIGATNVGSIHYSFTPNTEYKVGEEMGYFSFGGSAMILLFEPGVAPIASDILKASLDGMETLGKMGQPLFSDLV